MTRAEKLQERIDLVVIDDRCSDELSSGFRTFLSNLSPSHSITSIKFCIWSLIQEHLDDAFSNTMAKFEGTWNSDLLSDLRLSEVGLRLPKKTVHVTVRKKFKPVELKVPLIKPEAMPPANWQLLIMSYWDLNLNTALRLMTRSRKRPSGLKKLLSQSEPQVVSRPEDELYGALELARELILLLAYFRPKSTTKIPDHDSVPDSTTCSQEKTFCELCWRPTIRSSLLNEMPRPTADIDNYWKSIVNSGRVSNRYCETHKPGSNGYHADLRYKKAFERQLQVLMSRRNISTYAIDLMPNDHTMVALRKTAYEQVHARLRPISSSYEAAVGLKEKIWPLWCQGLSQSEIARELGVTRQAVFKALAELRDIVSAHHASCDFDPITDELRISQQIQDSIRIGLENKESPSSIAKSVGLTKATVLELARSIAKLKE